MWSKVCCCRHCSVAQLFLTFGDPMDCSTPGLPVHHHLLELSQTMSIESVIPSNHLLLCCPLLLLPPIPPSIRVFSNEYQMAKLHSEEYSGLISFRIDWFDLLAVQGTLKSLLQHHSSKASILGCSAFFIVQLSHPYLTTGKTIASTRRTFVSEVTSLLFESHFLNPKETSKVTGNTGIVLKSKCVGCWLAIIYKKQTGNSL